MDAKADVKRKLDMIRADIIDLSHMIHSHPEEGFEEIKAAEWASRMLEEAGFELRRGVCDLPTAFIAMAGKGPLNLCFCAEYDALADIGHACGHNIIAAAAVGAGVAASTVADALGMTIAVIGTPAEENGDTGGKILLLERGAFDGMHAAMMIHPAPFDVLTPKIIAATMFDVHYTGKEAHASAFPEMGVNAADALTVAQTAIGLLRQHIPYTTRIHGIVTHGGDEPNVVPAHTSARYIVRGDNLMELERLRPRVYKCFEAGALATGCKVEIMGGEKPYSEMIHDPDIAGCFKHNSELLGRRFPDFGEAQQKIIASTDMGNVSLAVPSIHPMISIDSFPAVNHQREFTAHCVSAAADRALFDGALAMAWTAVDLAVDEKIRTRLLSGETPKRCEQKGT